MSNEVNEYMPTQVLRNVETGWCNIETPDTEFYQGGRKKKKPPQWKAEIIVDRDNEEMMKFFSAIHDHLRAHGEDIGDDEEPWVRTQPEKEKDGNMYPAYEYISVMTTKDPHTPTKTSASHIVDEENNPFTSEVWKGSDISVVLAPKFDTVHKYRITFYLNGMKVHRNGNGGGGGGGDPMALLGVPTADQLGGDEDGAELMAQL